MAFRVCTAALLVEWQAATKARQLLGADAKTSSDESGASAETDTSRAHQVLQSLHSCRPKTCDRHSWVCCVSVISSHLAQEPLQRHALQNPRDGAPPWT
jgi:hypothetical protein